MISKNNPGVRGNDDLSRLVDRFSNLRNRRGTYESQWREISQFVWPEADGFFQSPTANTKGDKNRMQVYDSTAADSLPKFSSVVSDLITPRGSNYQRLESANGDDDENVYYEEITKILFKHRNAYSANFQGACDVFFKSLGAFGNGCMFVDEDTVNKGQIRYKYMFLGDTYVERNHQGLVDTVYRRFTLTHHAATTRKEWTDNLPEQVTNQLETNPYGESEYLHVVLPDSESSKRRFKSYYFHVETKTLLEEGHYRTMPYIFTTWEDSVYEDYGIGPGGLALPTIRVLNRQERTQLRSMEKIVDPTIIAHDDGWTGGREQVSLDPATIIFGAVSAEGRALMQPLQTGARVEANFQDMEYKRNLVKSAFLLDHYNLQDNTKRMTAHEVAMRMREQGALLGPKIGRLETGFLGLLTERELDLLDSMGKLPAPPSTVDEYEIRFQSPLTRLQQSEEQVGNEAVLQMAVALAQFDPNIPKYINAVAMLRSTRKGTGAGLDIINSDEAVAEAIAAEQEQQQGQNMLEAAPALAGAAKDMAMAQQINQGA